jgi:hypothetical protein
MPPIWVYGDIIYGNSENSKSLITNSDLCKIANIDTLTASKLFSKWVVKGMLIPDKSKGTRGSRYSKPGQAVEQLSLFLLSNHEDNKKMYKEMANDDR